MKHTSLIALLFLSAVTITSCKKFNYEVSTDLKIKLISSSFDADQITIDIQQVQVNFADTAWVTLNTTTHLYKLLDLQNGLDTLIANGNIPASSVIKKIKVVFGSENTIVKNDKSSTLSLAANQNEMVLPVDRKLNKSVEAVTIRLDPFQSISQTKDGGYQFIPVGMIN